MIELAPETWRQKLLLGPTSTTVLALATIVPAIVAAWLLMSPDQVFSREMIWDLLFNLEGAWHLEHGHAAHVDFHNPLGVLAFAFTRIGFGVVGLSAKAFLVGQTIVMVAIGAIAVPIAARRFAPLPALLFTTYVVLLILLPANIGDAPHAYTFAMSYNRWAWAALATLCLLLFVEPRGRRPASELALAAVLCVFLFYLKITFAVGALGAIVAAMMIVGRVREQWRWWLGLVVALALVAALPLNQAYVRETWAFGTSGYARVDPLYLINILAADRAEYAVYGLAIGLLVWLWQAGHASTETWLSAIVLVGLGVAVLTQNAQDADIPLGIVIWLLAYNALTALATGRRPLPPSQYTWILMIALFWPLLSVGTAAKIFAGYYRAATAEAIVAPQTTNLRGVAFPPQNTEVRDALARTGYQLKTSTRETPLRDPVEQSEYVDTLLEAARELAGQPQKVLVIDQVNPMPFVLGYPPPRGSLLWLGPSSPGQTADDLFRDVDVVLVPKHSTYAPATVLTLSAYHEYLAQNFPTRTETASWTFLRRAEEQ